jgi:hypothetical protein
VHRGPASQAGAQLHELYLGTQPENRNEAIARSQA